MSIHIDAKKDEIANVVLMAGDPLRVKFFSEKYLKDYKLVSSVRGNFAYTGYYKDKLVTIMASGMGMPSIGIYSYELYKEYDVDLIIRVGSSGAYSDDLKLYDVVLATEAYSESTYAKVLGSTFDFSIPSSEDVNQVIINTAKELKIHLYPTKVHSSDVFYSEVFDYKKALDIYGVECVEMESFALFANANLLNKKAACILTISDTFGRNEKLSSIDRQTKFDDMFILALESALKYIKK